MDQNANITYESLLLHNVRQACPQAKSDSAYLPLYVAWSALWRGLGKLTSRAHALLGAPVVV
eukprot:6303753-Amphidinium_carterae.1